MQRSKKLKRNQKKTWNKWKIILMKILILILTRNLKWIRENKKLMIRNSSNKVKVDLLKIKKKIIPKDKKTHNKNSARRLVRSLARSSDKSLERKNNSRIRITIKGHLVKVNKDFKRMRIKRIEVKIINFKIMELKKDLIKISVTWMIEIKRDSIRMIETKMMVIKRDFLLMIKREILLRSLLKRRTFLRIISKRNNLGRKSLERKNLEREILVRRTSQRRDNSTIRVSRMVIRDSRNESN
jgi:hypothetical protein